MPNLRQNASLPQLNVHSKNIINLTVEGCFIQLSVEYRKCFNLCKSQAMICFEVFHESIPLCRVFSTILHVLMFCPPQAERR